METKGLTKAMVFLMNRNLICLALIVKDRCPQRLVQIFELCFTEYQYICKGDEFPKVFSKCIHLCPNFREEGSCKPICDTD